METPREPTLRDLRVFGLVLAAFFGILGLLGLEGVGSPQLASTSWAFGAFLTLAYYVLPPLQRPMFMAWMTLASPLAWLVSNLILGAAYYFVLTPIGVVLRLCRHDPLRSRREPSASTYWLRRHARNGRSRYLKQF